MTNNQLTEQQIDMLIENGYDIAYTLENLADNEINSDCFEVFSYSESGRETEWDGKITEFAQHAAKAIRHLTDATTALQVELEERRKADSEPVAWSNGCNKSVPAALRYLAENPRPRGGESSFNTAHLYQLAREIEFMAEAPLYRHAQQPVVPDRSIFEKWWESQNGAPLDGWDSLRATDGYCDDGIDGQFEAWNACRAAMLQELQKSAGDAGDVQISRGCRTNENVQDLQAGKPPVVPVQLTDEQIDAVLDSNGNMAYVIADKRERLRMFAREILRAAMLLAQSDDDGEPTDDERIMAIEGIHNCERCGDEGWVVGEMGITRCMCGQAGNSPVIGIDLATGADRTVEVRYVAPPGYVMVPKEPTERMVIDGFESEPDETFSEPEVWEAFQKMSGCEQAAFRARLCWAAMLAAAPQEVPDGK